MDRPEQAAYLALSGLQEGSTAFVEQLECEAAGSPWWPVAARWDTRALHRTLYHHDGMVNAVAVTALGGEPMVVSGGEDETVRICSLIGTGDDEAVVADLGTPVLSLRPLSWMGCRL
ncbi:MAG: WD40 repeat domain-containing protein [Pseudonocardiaceae bacterium]